MPTYLTPGVYLEEVPSTSKPIEGVSTSIAAFVGLAPSGPVNMPTRISNWTQFATIFGDSDDGPFMPGAYLAHSVFGFFNNGGGVCWVVRVGESGNAVAALPAASDTSIDTYRASALADVKARVSLTVTENPAVKSDGEGDGDRPAAEPTYRIVVSADGQPPEEYDNLTLKRGRNNIATKINAASKLIKIEEIQSALPEAQRGPASGTYDLSPPAATPEQIEPTHISGDVAEREGLGGLAAVDEINMVVVPDLWSVVNGDQGMGKILQEQIIAHCENAGNRMAILDSPPDQKPAEVLNWRLADAGYDSKFATLYWPWIEVSNPLDGGRPIMVPPSGHVAGVWCRTDETRGVHKAPANEVTRGATRVAFQITNEEQGNLNKNGINCIRSFSGRGIRIWGGRTLSSDPEWRYINVRRLFNYISESILQGTQWSVFEPNDQKLWIQLRIAVSSFLTRTWREGALFGSSPDQAFFVKCDAETNPPDVVEAGQVVCQIGISPVKPAEFVIFRLSQYADGAGQIEA